MSVYSRLSTIARDARRVYGSVRCDHAARGDSSCGCSGQPGRYECRYESGMDLSVKPGPLGAQTRVPLVVPAGT
jgi:hypothetical protein